MIDTILSCEDMRQIFIITTSVQWEFFHTAIDALEDSKRGKQGPFNRYAEALGSLGLHDAAQLWLKLRPLL